MCRYGECVWDERRAAKLRYMLESAVQRRFPRGTKVRNGVVIGSLLLGNSIAGRMTIVGNRRGSWCAATALRLYRRRVFYRKRKWSHLTLRKPSTGAPIGRFDSYRCAEELWRKA